MFWDWDYTWEIMPILAEASIVTIEATVLGFILAAVVGLLLAILRMSPRQWVSLPAAGFVEFVRSTPLLIQIFFIYFVLAGVAGEVLELQGEVEQVADGVLVVVARDQFVRAPVVVAARLVGADRKRVVGGK